MATFTSINSSFFVFVIKINSVFVKKSSKNSKTKLISETEQESNSQISNFYMEKNLIYTEHYSVFCIEKEEKRNNGK